MAISDCHMFKNSFEHLPLKDIERIPNSRRGLYVLFHGDGKEMNVVYIGMARGVKAGMKARIRSHLKQKNSLWTHFSVYEVWDNISRLQIEELEGLFRHIYRKDVAANRLNVQKTYRPLTKIRRLSEEDWV